MPKNETKDQIIQLQGRLVMDEEGTSYIMLALRDLENETSIDIPLTPNAVVTLKKWTTLAECFNAAKKNAAPDMHLGLLNSLMYMVNVPAKGEESK
jgi:hypothetical protein